MSVSAESGMQYRKPMQVTPLPIGSGGNNDTKKHMNENNTNLTMLMAQSQADTKYDPSPPTPLIAAHTSKTIEGYCSRSSNIAYLIGVVGVCCIVYGFFKK
jgi:hypothetical protein